MKITRESQPRDPMIMTYWLTASAIEIRDKEQMNGNPIEKGALRGQPLAPFFQGCPRSNHAVVITKKRLGTALVL